jgi:hypothetical protein
MKILMSLTVVVGVALVALIVVIGVWVATVTVRSVLKARQKHDPIEYYAGWGGYRHPISLQRKITKEEADAIAAAGNAYLIGYFDADGKLARVVKMLRGEVFFEIVYAYYPNGKRRSATVTGSDGRVTVLEYDTRGRGVPAPRQTQIPLRSSLPRGSGFTTTD